MPLTLPSFVRPTITFMSDFGWVSPGLGVMKAAALALAPQAQIIDITHEITPFSIIEGACMLELVTDLPRGGIHVCVVDPGVGSARRVLAIQTHSGDRLVGPDNGVLRPAALRLGGIAAVVSVTNQAYLLKKIGATFDGRDVMTPAAAALANGVPLSALGEMLMLNDLHPPAYEEAPWSGQGFEATILHVNRYGNVYLNIDNTAFREKGFKNGGYAIVTTPDGREHTIAIAAIFAGVEKGEPLLFEGHYGRVQGAVNQGSLARMIGLEVGAKIQIAV
jgi:hypothetical protein